MKYLPIIIFLSLVNLYVYSQERDLISVINQYRFDQGQNHLITEEKLNETAYKYALELIKEGKLSHLDHRGYRVLDRYRLLGGTAVEAGEILGTSTNIYMIFDAWKKSQSHNVLMLSPKWLRIGSSVIKTEEGLVAVVLFSISQLSDIRYENIPGSVIVVIDSIDNRELIFPSYINFEKVISVKSEYNQYKVQIPEEKTPLLITLSGDIDGHKKMTDFLYIP